MGLVAGVLSVKADGQQASVGGSCEVDIFDTIREPVESMTTAGLFSEKNKNPHIEFEAITSENFNIEDFDFTGGVVQVDLKNGKKYVLRDAYRAGEAPISTGDGTVTLRYEGTSMDSF